MFHVEQGERTTDQFMEAVTTVPQLGDLLGRLTAQEENTNNTRSQLGSAEEDRHLAAVPESSSNASLEGLRRVLTLRSYIEDTLRIEALGTVLRADLPGPTRLALLDSLHSRGHDKRAEQFNVSLAKITTVNELLRSASQVSILPSDGYAPDLFFRLSGQGLAVDALADMRKVEVSIDTYEGVAVAHDEHGFMVRPLALNERRVLEIEVDKPKNVLIADELERVALASLSRDSVDAAKLLPETILDAQRLARLIAATDVGMELPQGYREVLAPYRQELHKKLDDAVWQRLTNQVLESTVSSGRFYQDFPEAEMSINLLNERAIILGDIARLLGFDKNTYRKYLEDAIERQRLDLKAGKVGWEVWSQLQVARERIDDMLGAMFNKPGISFR